MISFENDYNQGAHPEILKRLVETNREPLSGYGTDPYCESARKKVLAACGCEEGEVHFLGRHPDQCSGDRRHVERV